MATQGIRPVAARPAGLVARLDQTLYLPLIRKAWPIWAGALAYAFANILMTAYARSLGVFPQIAMWGASLYNLFGIKAESPFYPLAPVFSDLNSMINIGIVLGVLGVALMSREFKFRTDSPRGYFQGFVGGVLMGVGTVLTPLCNVGGFGSAIMALSLSGFLMGLGLLPGAYVGSRFLGWQARKAVDRLDLGKAARVQAPAPESRSIAPALGWVVIALLVTLAALYGASGKPNFAVMLLFGALFGVIFQRSRLCFAAAFRDVFTTRDTALLRWIVISLMVGIAGFSILKFKGFVPAAHFVQPASIFTVAGGFIFGIGMVVAGGCGVGILWRSAEGYVRHWFALLGGMLAAGSWVLVYGQTIGKGWAYGPKVFLPDTLGWTGALIAAGAGLAAFYLFLTWMEVRKK